MEATGGVGVSLLVTCRGVSATSPYSHPTSFCINIKRRESFLECGGSTPLFALHGQLLYDTTYPLRRKRNRAADCRQGNLSALRCRKRLDAIRIGG